MHVLVCFSTSGNVLHQDSAFISPTPLKFIAELQRFSTNGFNIKISWLLLLQSWSCLTNGLASSFVLTIACCWLLSVVDFFVGKLINLLRTFLKFLLYVRCPVGHAHYQQFRRSFVTTRPKYL